MTSNRSHDDEHIDHGGRARLLKLLAIWDPRVDNLMRLFQAARVGLTEESAEALSVWLDKTALLLATNGMVLDGVVEMTCRESARSHIEYVYFPVRTSGKRTGSVARDTQT